MPRGVPEDAALQGPVIAVGAKAQQVQPLRELCARVPVDKALRGVCAELDIVGASTHSLRRSALTAASDKGVPLRVLQSISGHSSLEMLQRYLDVRDEAKRAAAMAFG